MEARERGTESAEDVRLDRLRRARHALRSAGPRQRLRARDRGRSGGGLDRLPPPRRLLRVAKAPSAPTEVRDREVAKARLPEEPVEERRPPGDRGVAATADLLERLREPRAPEEARDRAEDHP